MRRLPVFTLLVVALAATGYRRGEVPAPPLRMSGETLSGETIVAKRLSRPAAAGIAELPREFLDTTPPRPTGRVLFVPAEGRVESALNAFRRALRLPAGGRLQAALDRARPGDVVELQAGATFVGNFILRSKSEGGWIIVRSSAHERLPPAGSRVSPAHTALMPRLATPNARPAIRTAPGARGVRLVGIEIAPAPGVFVHSLVELGALEESPAALPADIVVDRCYLHADPAAGGRRGVALNGMRMAVIDSHLSGFKEVGADSQAIMGWNGPGPFKIVNNYLEGAGENVMFGGDDPRIAGLVPGDIEIRGNDFSKPLAWRRHDPSYAGTPWTVKNLLELKNARRVLVEGNVFERNWAQTQHGLAIVFTPRNQHGRAPWSTVEDVTFRHNIIRMSTGGFFILGWDNLRSSRQLRRVLIQGNLFVDIGAFTETALPDEGVLFLISDGPTDVVIDSNTAFHEGAPIRATDQIAGRWPARGFVFSNNLLVRPGGPAGDGSGADGDPGTSLGAYFPGAPFTGNVLARGRSAADLVRGGAAAPPGGADLAAISAAVAQWRHAP